MCTYVLFIEIQERKSEVPAWEQDTVSVCVLLHAASWKSALCTWDGCKGTEHLEKVEIASLIPLAKPREGENLTNLC